MDKEYQSNQYFDALAHDIIFLTEWWSQEDKEKFAQRITEWCKKFPYLSNDEVYNFLHYKDR